MSSPPTLPAPGLAAARPTITAVQGGTNRAANAMRKTYRQLLLTEGVPVGHLGIDSRGRRAADYAATLLPLGVAAQGQHGRIEDYVGAGSSGHPLVLTVDTIPPLRATVHALQRQGAPRMTAAYFIARASQGQLLGFATALPEGDEEHLATYAQFLERFDRSVVPGTYMNVFGGRYAAEAFSAEPLVREGFNSQLGDILPKAAAGLPLDRPPIEVFWRGRFLPLDFHDRTFGWGDPSKLAEISLKRAGRVLRGNAFAMAEAGPDDGLRFHHVHLRSDRDEAEILDQLELGSAAPDVSPIASASHHAPMTVTD